MRRGRFASSAGSSVVGVHELRFFLPDAVAAAMERQATPERHPLSGRLFAESPLPQPVAYFYCSGGCYLLAWALAEESQLPMGAELNPWGRAVHAFVVDVPAEEMIDAFGRRPIDVPDPALLRVGWTIGAILETLKEHPNGALVARPLRSREARERARQTARFLLGLPPAPTSSS